LLKEGGKSVEEAHVRRELMLIMDATEEEGYRNEEEPEIVVW
jgi:hypothetical protein